MKWIPILTRAFIILRGIKETNDLPLNPLGEQGTRCNHTIEVLLPLWAAYLKSITDLDTLNIDILRNHIGDPSSLLSSKSGGRHVTAKGRGGYNCHEIKNDENKGGFVEYHNYNPPNSLDALVDKKWLFSTFLDAILREDKEFTALRSHFKQLVLSRGKDAKKLPKDNKKGKKKRDANDEDEDGDEDDEGEGSGNAQRGSKIKPPQGVARFKKSLKYLAYQHKESTSSQPSFEDLDQADKEIVINHAVARGWIKSLELNHDNVASDFNSRSIPNEVFDLLIDPDEKLKGDYIGKKPSSGAAGVGSSQKSAPGAILKTNSGDSNDSTDMKLSTPTLMYRNMDTEGADLSSNSDQDPTESETDSSGNTKEKEVESDKDRFLGKSLSGKETKPADAKQTRTSEEIPANKQKSQGTKEGTANNKQNLDESDDSTSESITNSSGDDKDKDETDKDSFLDKPIPRKEAKEGDANNKRKRDESDDNTKTPSTKYRKTSDKDTSDSDKKQSRMTQRQKDKEENKRKLKEAMKQQEEEKRKLKESQKELARQKKEAKQNSATKQQDTKQKGNSGRKRSRKKGGKK